MHVFCLAEVCHKGEVRSFQLENGFSKLLNPFKSNWRLKKTKNATLNGCI